MEHLPTIDHNIASELEDTCKKIVQDIIKQMTRISTIIFQFHSPHEITVGMNAGGSYKDVYYSNDHANEIINVSDEMTQNINGAIPLFTTLYDHIRVVCGNNRYRSYNVIFHFSKKESTFKINICKNRIGAMSIRKSRLFEQITGNFVTH